MVASLAATAIFMGTGLAAAQDESSSPASDIVDLVPTTPGGMAPVAVVFPGAIALGQDASPISDVAPTPSLAAPGRDLYLDMPYYIGGFEPEIVMTRGAEHFANLDPDDPTDAATQAEIERFLDAVGASMDDMVSGYALVAQEDFFSFVVAIRIEDVKSGSLLPAYLPVLTDDLVDPVSTARTLGGKDVVVISSVGDDGEYVDLYVYDAGDTLWMTQGPEDVVETTLLNLP